MRQINELTPLLNESTTKERIALLKRFIKQFGKTRTIRLFADREFIGKEWFAWLKQKRLLVVAVIAFCWARRVGEWQHEQVYY